MREDPAIVCRTADRVDKTVWRILPIEADDGGHAVLPERALQASRIVQFAYFYRHDPGRFLADCPRSQRRARAAVRPDFHGGKRYAGRGDGHRQPVTVPLAAPQ